MERYNRITNKNQREIVLLQGFPCFWGKCRFCDYTLDNSRNEEEMTALNAEILSHVTGEFGVLEVINSGSCFEIPKETLELIRDIIYAKGICSLKHTGATAAACRKCVILWAFPLLIRLA